MSKAWSFPTLPALVLACVCAAPVEAQSVAAFQARAIPAHVPPRAGEEPARWVTRVLVSVESPAATDLPIHLSAESPAVLSTPYVEIRRGTLSASVEVTAVEKGDAEICAWTELSSALATTRVSFHLPPTKLRVTVEPARGLSVGSAAGVTVRVTLCDQYGDLSAADHDTPVALTLSLGRLDRDLSIPAGTPSAAVLLTSFRPGSGRVVAEARGLKSGQDEVEFVFPWGILTVAMLGGAFGAAYQSGLRSLRALALAALPGLAFGLVAYGLVAFLPANDLPGIIRPLAALPVTSGLATAVLGLAGGYGGRRFLPVGSPMPRAAAHGSAHPVEALSRS